VKFRTKRRVIAASSRPRRMGNAQNKSKSASRLAQSPETRTRRSRDGRTVGRDASRSNGSESAREGQSERSGSDRQGVDALSYGCVTRVRCLVDRRGRRGGEGARARGRDEDGGRAERD